MPRDYAYLKRRLQNESGVQSVHSERMSYPEFQLYEAARAIWNDLPDQAEDWAGLTPQWGVCGFGVMKNYEHQMGTRVWYAERAYWKRRLDFAVAGFGFTEEELKVAVEVDDYSSHHTAEQKRMDADRQRAIESLGWVFVRIPKAQVDTDPLRAAKRVFNFAQKRARSLRKSQRQAVVH